MTAIPIVQQFHFTPTQTRSKQTACSGLDNFFYDVNMKIELCVTFYNELLNNHDTFNIEAMIVKETPMDLIIGRDSIKKYQLFDKIPSQLIDVTKQRSPTTKSEILTVSPPRRILSSLILRSRNILGGSLPDDDEIDHDKTDTFKFLLPIINNSDINKISGSNELQHKSRALCCKYKDIFSNELQAAPAKIPKFALTVQTDKWEVAKNRAPPRPQSALKQTALFLTIETLLRQGIIIKSDSSYYSQVLLVPKTDSTFRMCVD